MSVNHRNISLVVALVAADLALCAASAIAGETPGAVTISLSGSTAMRAFTTNVQFTSLTPGRSITLANGAGGNPTNTYTAEPVNSETGVFPGVQLGALTNDAYPVPNSLKLANYLAMRVEWHEQGSVEGILEMANDQIGTINTIAASNRNPTIGNPTWINGSKGSPAGGYKGYIGQTGGTDTTGPLGGFNQSSHNTYTNYTLAGSNLQGGQNRVQMAISDVKATQGFSYSGASGAWNKTPGQAGYGKGNAALNPTANTSGVGTPNSRQQLSDQSVLNMTADKIDPGTGANYDVDAVNPSNSPWASAGVNNLNNAPVAVTATTFAANPGTGLTKLNRTDAQFLQATGRLANGADFNVVTRDVNSGTRNVASLNVGLDPSFSVGENDGGDTGSVVAATDGQQTIGDSIRFSGKTAGGGGLRPVVQNSRMAIGHLSIGDARSANSAGSSSTPNAGARPLRVLAYRDDANDVADASNATLQAAFADPANGSFVKPSFDTITDGTYVIYQNETYVTVKVPTAAAYNADKIKGDNSNDDVRDLRDNILASAGTYPNNASFLNPANGLIANGFIPTQYMRVEKAEDGLNRSSTNAAFTTSTADFNSVRGQALSQFDVGDAGQVTKGTGSTYGGVSGGIAITDGNYLFGDFDNDGDRDFADVKLAVAAQKALYDSGAGTSFGNGTAGANNQAVGVTGALLTMTGFDGTPGAKKGDLIVKGDYNSDGRFTGKDIYLLAHGASLADNTSTDTLGTASGANFGDQVRRGVLRKNAALDYLNTPGITTDQQRGEASVDGIVGTADDVNAFNKLDVNRDGKVDRVDASIVDKFVGKNVASLDDQLGAIIATDGTLSTTVAQRSLGLVDAELTDDLAITATLVAGNSDFSVIRVGLGGALVNGDADFSGTTDFADLLTLAKNYNTAGDRWSKGDFDLDGTVGFSDLLLLAKSYNASSPADAALLAPSFAADWSLAQSLVPEPTALLGLLGAVTMARRTRRARD